MVLKRPFDEDDSNEVSFKEPRQHELNSEDDKNPAEIKPECSEKLDVTNDEHPFHNLLSPVSNYNSSECPQRTNVNPREIYSYLLDHPPRKYVPIGPDFQACIPEYGSQARESSQIEKLYVQSDELVGRCIIPMPDPNSGNVGFGRTDCLCEDVCSIRCVKQHILEARDNLERTLGPETFSELGFCDMGEIVAEDWSEDEEQLFHEVIFSNPGKNFWDHLAVNFPYRTMEIVSYYFNVFMLRRRAEQNRFDPMNIDSDNDEWHDSADSEAEVEEYVDSVIGSPDKNNDFDENVNVNDHKVTSDKNDNHKQCGGQINGLDFMFEGFNARERDFRYSTHPGNEIDLLPTCSMIEEVFGAGS